MTTTGLDVTTDYGVHFDPFDKKRMFISYTDIGLFGSEDGGQGAGAAPHRRLPRAWVNTTYWMEFDPEVKGRVWAVMPAACTTCRVPRCGAAAVRRRYNGGVCTQRRRRRAPGACQTDGMPPTAATHIRARPPEPGIRARST